jgi:hypothetical protein
VLLGLQELDVDDDDEEDDDDDEPELVEVETVPVLL